jgi:hypothetical protein
MKKLREFRAKAALCRQLAVREPANRDLWFAEAEKWLREEQEEIFGTSQDVNGIRTENARGVTLPFQNEEIVVQLGGAHETSFAGTVLDLNRTAAGNRDAAAVDQRCRLEFAG